MREIKFRAWDKDDEEMHKDVTPMYRDGELENIIFDYENAGYNFIDIEIKYCDTVFLYEDNPYIIMQYTGLKDVNGVEIYEGDVLPEGYVVTFIDGSEPENLGMDVGFYGQRDNFESWFTLEVGFPHEVIGNIHEHPELLGDNQ